MRVHRREWLRCCTTTCYCTTTSHQLSAAASCSFKQGQHIRHAEQFEDLLARVHHFQPAAARSRRNVQRHHRSQSRTVHHRYFLQIQDNSPFSPAGLAHRLFQQRHILGRQPPKAFHHRAILPLGPLYAKSSRRIRRLVYCHLVHPFQKSRVTRRLARSARGCTSFPAIAHTPAVDC